MYIRTKQYHLLVKSLFIIGLLLILTLFSHNSLAQDRLRVASAANFSPVLKKLISDFEQQHSIKVDIISAATGTLYQQILHGAPYDIFLSADAIRPEQLVQQQLTVKNTLTPYAIGQLSFYAPKQPQLTFDDFLANSTQFKRIAIANPDYAPYGQAAKQLLQNSQHWKAVEKKLIIGINVGQTFQQTHSQAVDAGFVATSQLRLQGILIAPITNHQYQPIVQKAVVLKQSKQPNKAIAFIDYLTSAKVQATLQQFGYLTAPTFH